MRSFSGPHAITPLPQRELLVATSGQWRDWDTSAQSCVSFRELFQLWAKRNQAGRCAYCIMKVSDDASRAVSVDHFVPKSVAPRWTFEPWNLVLACHACNARKKRVFNPLILRVGEDVDSVAYRQCVFKIVHPYIDDVSRHINGGYDGPDSAPELVWAITHQGEATIRLFGLATPGRFQEWMSDYLGERYLNLVADLGALGAFKRLQEETSGR